MPRLGKTMMTLQKDYPELKTHVEGLLGGLSMQARNTIENGLSLGGLRVFKEADMTAARSYCRAVILCTHLVDQMPLTGAISKWSGKKSVNDTPELRNKLAALTSALKVVSLATVMTPSTQSQAEYMAKIGGVKMGGPPPVVIGQTKMVASSDGRWHSLLGQVLGSSCGPTCVAMVAKLAINMDVGGEEIRRGIEMVEGGTVTKIASEKSAGKSGSHDWGNKGNFGSGHGGVGTWNLEGGLAWLKLPFRELPKGSNVEASLKLTTYKKPAIAVIEWGNGGLHWVVVAGPITKPAGATAYLVLDPACGLKEVEPAIGSYQVPNDIGTFTGQMFLLT